MHSPSMLAAFLHRSIYYLYRRHLGPFSRRVDLALCFFDADLLSLWCGVWCWCFPGSVMRPPPLARQALVQGPGCRWWCARCPRSVLRRVESSRDRLSSLQSSVYFLLPCPPSGSSTTCISIVSSSFPSPRRVRLRLQHSTASSASLAPKPYHLSRGCSRLCPAPLVHAGVPHHHHPSRKPLRSRHHFSILPCHSSKPRLPQCRPLPPKTLRLPSPLSPATRTPLKAMALSSRPSSPSSASECPPLAALALCSCRAASPAY